MPLEWVEQEEEKREVVFKHQLKVKEIEIDRLRGKLEKSQALMQAKVSQDDIQRLSYSREYLYYV